MAAAVGDESLVGVAAHHLGETLVALEDAGVHVVDAVFGPQFGNSSGVSGVDAGRVGGEDPQDGELVLRRVEAGEGVGDPGFRRGESGFEGVEAVGVGGGSHGLDINASTHRKNTL